MNKLLFQIAILFFCSDLFAQEPGTSADANQGGMKFFQGTWAEVLTESQKTGKPIFVDAYASWCSPCRLMAVNTFPDEEVGKFFNGHFINYKIDMEKGEGPALNIKYRVTHYPTYLFVDAQGNLKYRVMGYMVPDMFLREGKKSG